jgi:hypothetical protein
MTRPTRSGARKAPWWAAFLSAAILLSPGCSDDTTPSPAAPVGTVVVQFDHTVGAAPLEFDRQIYTNAAGNQFGVTTFQYLVSRFRLHRPAALRHEGDYEPAAVHFRDGREDATRTITFDDVPTGDYAHLSFVFGLTNEDNVTGAHPEHDAAMLWPDNPPAMLGGYHYMKCEGTWGSGPANFATHTGRSSDGVDRSFEVELELHGSLRHGFEVVEGQTVTVRVSMDLAEWYSTPHTYDFADHGPIMEDPVAQQLLHENGSPAFGSGVFSLAH